MTDHYQQPEDASHPGDIKPTEFRAALHHAADLVADYLENVGHYPVLPPVKPGDLRSQLPASPPPAPTPINNLLNTYRQIIEPACTHWNHPGFMGYFSITGSGPGIIGETLAAALNVNAMLWHTGPAPTELEQLTCDWLRQALGLPEQFAGHINDTASMSSLVALAAARERRHDLQIRHQGMAGRNDLPALTVYCSDQAHSSIDKAIITLGLGLDNLRRVPSDPEYRLNPAALDQAIAHDRAAGRLPLAVVATAGTTSTTSVDPLGPIADICQRENLWLHVDGAYAGVTALCPEFRNHFAGIERADSYVTNPHKWLFVPIDCSVLFVRDQDLLKRAFSIVPDYLQTSHGDVTNLMDLGVQLGRRFRALKLWMVISAFGISGLQERIRYHCHLAREFADWVEHTPGLALAAPVPFSTVCFRATTGPTLEDQNELNRRLLAEVNQAGPVLLSHTVLRGRYVLRLAVGNLRTRREHVQQAQNLIAQTHARLVNLAGT